MKKLIPIFLLLCLLCGCSCMDMNIKLYPDGTGTYTVRTGMTAEMINELKSQGFEVETGTVTFEKHNTAYLGDIATGSFQSIDEINDALDGFCKVIPGSNSYTIEFFYTEEAMYDQTNMHEDVSAEDIEKMMDSMVFEVTFDLPHAPVQTAGSTEAVTIYQNTVTVDILKAQPDTIVIYSGPSSMFTDVSADAWYYTAVNALYNGGLVSGYGDGRMGPSDHINFDALAVMLAKVLDLPIGADATGYWGAKSIDAIIDAGYMDRRGDTNTANFGIPIFRQEAISALTRAYLAVEGANLEVVNPNPSIPDFDSISADLQQDILNAYKYGITSGVDEHGTFNAFAPLTRAEMCQLFYNLKWTTAHQGVQ